MDWSREFAKSVDVGTLPENVIKALEQAQSFCGAEGTCWDFKREGIGDDGVKYAETIKDIVGFFNTFGGFIIFGIEEIEKDTRFQVVGINGTPLSLQKLKGLLATYARTSIDVSYSEYSLGSHKIGVLHVPKRPAALPPVRFSGRAPEKKGKPVFEPEHVPLRRNDVTRFAQSLDDWQLLFGPRTLDLLGLDLGRIQFSAAGQVRLPHNLPMRSAICANFIGRADVLSTLWKWLNDEFQYARVIAGDGGKGKTSLTYEFCTQVASVAPAEFERIVWLTAKQRQFSGMENTWLKMPETHFSDFRSLLVALGDSVGYLENELEGVSEPELQRLIKRGIGTQKTLYIIDDLDSLTSDDQKRVLELCARIGASGIRFLVTTRSNASYSSDLCITLKGLEGKDYEGLVGMLSDKYHLNLPKGAVDSLVKATDGSPLLTDSILRLVRRGTNFYKAIADWKGAAGEDARKAVLQKEIEQLTAEARRVLLAIAFFGECSLAEIKTVVGLADIRLQNSLDELQSLFLVDAPKIIESQPRFEINVTAASLVIGQKESLAHDFARIEGGVRAARNSARKEAGQGNNPEVGKAISQALALSKGGDLGAAIETIEAALIRQKRHPDLLVARAHFRMSQVPRSLDEIRKDLRLAYDEGGRKERLFELWYQAERLAEYGQGLIEVAEKALREFPSDTQIWGRRKAEGFILVGLVRSKSGHIESAVSELGNAANELFLVCREHLDNDDYNDVVDYMYGVHDRVVQLMARVGAGTFESKLEIFHSMMDRGDYRPEILSRAFDAMKERIRIETRRGKLGDNVREWLISERQFYLSHLKKAEKGMYWSAAKQFANNFANLQLPN